MKKVTITVKQEMRTTIGDLLDECHSQLGRFKPHYYNIRHQYKFYRTLKRNTMSNECLMHIDFSENYVCKMQNEVLSAPFGASKTQISLHTGVYYM